MWHMWFPLAYKNNSKSVQLSLFMSFMQVIKKIGW